MPAFEDLNKLNEELNQTEIEFTFLKNPSLLPQAYQSTLYELARRKQFNVIVQA